MLISEMKATFFPSQDRGKEMSLEQIIKKVNKLISSQHYGEAVLYSNAAASQFGAAGLYLHHLASYQYLKDEQSKTGEITREGIESYAKLLACEKLVADNEAELENLEKHFPEFKENGHTIFEKHQRELIALADLKDFISDAEQNVDMYVSLYKSSPTLEL